jgi:diguanylate cyclase (GGDEF)-like protein/PAS domain S-box-containing protein
MQAWTVTLLFSGAIYFFIAVFVLWRFRANPGAKSFAALCLALCIYSVGYYYEIHSLTMPMILFWLNIEYIGIAPFPVLWLVFVMHYTKQERWLSKITIATLFIIPVITYIMVFTNSYHHLFYRFMTTVMENGLQLVHAIKGPWYWVHICYINMLVLIGNIILFQSWKKTQRPYNRQYAAMFLGSLFPWLALFIYLSGNSPHNLDLSPFGMIISVIIYAFGLMHYRIFDIMPVASKVVLENMRDGVLVVDKDDRIIDLNAAAANLFGKKSDLLGRKLDTLFQPSSGISVNFMNTEAGHMEFLENTPSGFHWLDVSFSPITNSRGETGGYAIIVRDVTKNKMSQAELELANMELYKHVDELKKINLQMQLLHEMSSQLQACDLLEDTYPIIVEYLQLLLPNLQGALYIHSTENINMEQVCSWNNSQEMKIAIENSECLALIKGNPYRADNDILMTCEHIERKEGWNYTCIPLQVQGQNFGLISCFYPRNLLNDNKLYLARIITNEVVLALTNLKMRMNLKEQSIHDPLTGLFNRRYMEEILQLEMAQAKRMKHKLSVIMVDIDHYKEINDQYGHPMGDQVLSQVSKLLQENIRSGDIACRYGGDEFILILPGADLTVAVERAELIRHMVKKVKFKIINEGERITLSLGVATFPGHGSTLETLVSAADHALYRAKQEGRDQAIAAE